MDKKKAIEVQCTGCGLCHCALGCDFTHDMKGFTIPKLYENSIDKIYSSQICPFNAYREQQRFELWGNYLNVYEGFSTDNSLRFRASSGGVLTALSIYLLESGTVDAIIHTKKKDDFPLETEITVSTDREAIIRCIGSRYTQSSPLMDILSLVEKNKKYAFIGKPCDVLALKNYMSMNPELQSQIVITMSFFCAGIPSPMANEKLVQSMQCTINSLKDFQYRGDGWPGYATAVNAQNKKYQVDYQTAWSKYLGRDVRLACRFCMDGIGEAADIACADLWYLKEGNQPDFSEHDGRNIVFCRSALANLILTDAEAKGYVNVRDYKDRISQFSYIQPYHRSRRTTMKYRVLPMKLFGRAVPKYPDKLLLAASKYSNSKENWRVFKGTVQRIIKKKI